MVTDFPKRVLTITFTVYLIVVAAITVLPTHLTRLQSPHSDHINVIPLYYTSRCFLVTYRANRALLPFCLRNTFGNIALFMPFGILLPLVTSRFRKLTPVMLVALSLSLSIETTQFVLRFIGNARAVDIDDVLLNTFGACLGFLLYRLTRKRERGRGEKGEWVKGKG